MLNRKYRATRIDIESTIKTGIPLSGNVLYGKISRNNGEKATFAIVVSKKVEKTSVGRHLVKRKISAFLEANLDSIKKDFKKTIVFFVKNNKAADFFMQAEKDLKEILVKAGFFER